MHLHNPNPVPSLRSATPSYNTKRRADKNSRFIIECPEATANNRHRVNRRRRSRTFHDKRQPKAVP